MKYYCGVGSRETPGDVLEVMQRAAVYLRGEGYVLRSGHATGADWAFEQGAQAESLIFLPWRPFGQQRYGDDPGRPVLGKAVVAPETELLANYQLLVDLGIRTQAQPNRTVALLHGRNVLQVTDAQFVLCWCPVRNGQPQGGTATAVKLAEHWGIPVLNLLDADIMLRVTAKLTEG